MKSCPANSQSARGSKLLDSCQCNSGFTGGNSKTCTACEKGKYKIDIGFAVCTNCITGKYSVTEGASSASICIECVNGKYLIHMGASAACTCTDCDTCKFSVTAGVSTNRTCTECVTGKYSTTADAYSDNDCKSCQDNSISLSGSSLSTSCLCFVGYTGPDSGTCVSCEAGKYKATQGDQPCTICIKGKYSKTVVYSLDSTCTNCLIKDNNNNNNNNVCKYSTVPGASTDITCTD